MTRRRQKLHMTTLIKDKAKPKDVIPVQGEVLRRADGIYWSVLEVDSRFVLYEVCDMGECHAITLRHWLRLRRCGQLIAA